MRISARSARERGELVDPALDVLAAHRLRMGRDPLGALDHDLVDAGQQPGGLGAGGPAQQRHALRARGHGAHGGTGQQHVAGVVLTGDEHMGHGAPSSRSTASPRSVATSGAARISSGRVRSLGTSTPRAPAAAAASRSLAMSPTTAQRSGATPRRDAASRTRPGRGLRHAQPASGSCGHTSQGAERAEELLDALVDRGDLLGAQHAAADAALVGHHREPHARGAQAIERAARAVNRDDALGVCVVGDVDHERAVAVEEHGGRPRGGRGGCG